MNNNEVERVVAAWLAEEAPPHAPNRILSGVRMRVRDGGHDSFPSWRNALLAAAAITAVVAVYVLGGGLARAPIGPGATTSPSSYLSPSPAPSPTVDTTGRETTVMVYAGGPIDSTYLLAGDYALVAEGRAALGSDYCSVVAWAVRASFTGQGHESDSIQLTGYTGTSGGPFRHEAEKTFPRDTYRIVVTGTPPSEDATGDELCPEWSITLEAR
jgi:hypothetical protein